MPYTWFDVRIIAPCVGHLIVEENRILSVAMSLKLLHQAWCLGCSKLCSTNTPIMKPCRVRNVSNTHVGRTCVFLRIRHVFEVSCPFQCCRICAT